MLSVDWIKLKSGNWCNLATVNLDNVTSQGVYIIWHSGSPGRVVYVGQGDVKSRLLSHRQRRDMQQYGDLYVTWASVPASQRGGVERHLADKWNPLVGDAHPQDLPIQVNSPW